MMKKAQKTALLSLLKRCISFGIILCITASCATSMPLNEMSSTEIANLRTCDQLRQDITQMEKVIESQTPSQTNELLKDTAMSTARTGINMSGVFGNAGVFAGIGLNFAQLLYRINAKERQAQQKLQAQLYSDKLYDAYIIKECGQLDFINPAMDWSE